MTMFDHFRADGWPLCPHCGEDELWSRLIWNGEGERPTFAAYVEAGMACYLCRWDTETQNLLRELWQEFKDRTRSTL